MAYSNTRKPRHSGVFHVYNRAREGRALFLDDEDRMVFEDIANRHLGRRPRFDARGRQYENLRSKVGLVARCLPTTHFHKVLRQLEPGGMADLMRRVGNAYNRYFRQRHGGDGGLFDGEYRAKRIENRESLRWRIAYVHDNHRSGVDYRFSTHGLYVAEPSEVPDWLDVGFGLSAFGGVDAYRSYLQRREQRSRLDLELRGPQLWTPAS